MHPKFRLFTALCLLLIYAKVITLKAQTPARAMAPAISKADMSSAIDKMTAQIKARYVFPDKGDAIASHLKAAYTSGQYAHVKDWKTFADLTTKIIQHFSHDGHMYVRYDPARSQELLTSLQNKNASDKNDQATELTDTGATQDDLTQHGPDPFFYGPMAADHNYGFERVSITHDNIGYLHLKEINISGKSLPTLYAAMTFVSNTRALVIDLRNNGGGGSDTGAVFETYFLPEKLPLLTFSSRNGKQFTDSTVSWLKEKHYDRPVFILVNNKTASAAKAFAFVMQKTKRATIIGQPSAGAANMNVWLPVNEHLFMSVSESAPVWPGTTESWEQRGIQPDYITESDAEIDAFIEKHIGLPQFRP